MANAPFLGEFKMATEAVGAESGTDYSPNYIKSGINPTAAMITIGPHLSDNFSFDEPGPFSLPVTLTLDNLTQAQILALHANFNARSLMEFKFMHTAGTIDTPSATNMQWTVQFYMPMPPPVPTEVGAKATWEFTVNAKAGILTDGASPQNYGTVA